MPAESGWEPIRFPEPIGGTAGVPRPEYPRPQLVRSEWVALNGEWGFEIDRADSGIDRDLVEHELSGRITVPFAPESVLSGVEDVDFLEAVWYRRDVVIPESWAGRRLLLHFGAVDHDATVWVEGVEVARHRGGFTSFTADITDAVAGASSATVVVRARDPHDRAQARGKQSWLYANQSVHYTRTTGIWQSVWLEGVPAWHVGETVIRPELGARRFSVTVSPRGSRSSVDGARVRAVLADAQGEVAVAEADARLDAAPTLLLDVPPDRLRPWSITDPHLYALRVELLDGSGAVIDAVDSYAGLRSVTIDGRSVLINGERVFQRLVLDQGYWPESLMTAPSDEALVRDIELSMAAGFTGARLHQKVFEERFHYHADRLGYLTWAEFGDWGIGLSGDDGVPVTIPAQWAEAVVRDRNHPSIIGWCPMNETFQQRVDRIISYDDVMTALWRITAAADPTRPVLDVSGHAHRVRETQVWDSHDYEQDPAAFAATHDPLAAGGAPFDNNTDGVSWSVPYSGQPYWVSEFGGIWWNPELAAAAGTDRDASWGYGDRVRDEEGFHARFGGLTGVLLGNAEMFGYCYTQLTDTFQEQNGIYRFDRTEKLDTARVRAAQQRVAAYETDGPA